MSTKDLGIMGVKVVALAVSNLERANRFYGEVLGLPSAIEGGGQVGFLIGQAILMLKSDWYGKPTTEPNPRITIEVEDARALERKLRECGVTISDAVQLYDGCPVGSFLDSEGNKLWFCSAP